jgi:hypothetical protein
MFVMRTRVLAECKALPKSTRVIEENLVSVAANQNMSGVDARAKLRTKPFLS